MMSSSTDPPSASLSGTTSTPSNSPPAPALTISSFSVNLGAGLQSESEIAFKHRAGGDKVLYMTLDKFGELKSKVTAAARDLSLIREKNSK